MKNSGILAAITAALLYAAMGTAALAGMPADNCDTESLQAMAPADTTVAFAAREGGGCRVGGYVTTRDPGPNKVLFALGLPNAFNGRYVYLGVGGAAGELPVLRPELLAKGFAVSGSDGGTGAKNFSDFSFKSNPAKLADFQGRGVHVVAMATQQITKTYYAQNSIHRYISGCSGGGQMGLTNALKFGTQDFDGFVVGATPWPGHNVFRANVWRLAQYLQTHPDAWISPELLKRADAAILAAYDATDGAVDGIIADQRNIKEFDVDILRKIGFTSAQITMFDMVRKPHSFALAGGASAVQPGYSITNVASWTQYIFGTSPPPWPSTQTLAAEQVLANGAPYFHVMADTDTRASHPTLDYSQLKNPTELTKLALSAAGGTELLADPDAAFSRFGNSGAKMIVYHGVDDQAMSYFETLQSYQALSKEHGDIANWLRVFTMPGLMHCRGGPGTTNSEEPLIDALVNWVEKSQAPDTIIVNRVSPAKGLERTFRLCSEPTRAFLKRPGEDPTKAENWECRVSAAQH
jgi:feruloyl esterase